MASAPIDKPEFSFQPVNLITEVITDSSPDDPHWVPLAPGEAHTLVVDEGEEEMLTFFVTRGSLIYTDADGHQVGYEDVFTRLKLAREHFEAAGLDQTILDAMIR